MQEGSNWEAIMAAAQFGLDNLALVIDHNRLQQGARLAETNNLAPFAPKLEAGHDMEALCRSLSREAVIADKPKCVVAHTRKGQGVSFMTDNVARHHKVPNGEGLVPKLGD